MADSIIDDGTDETVTLVFPSGSIAFAFGSVDLLKLQLDSQIQSVGRRKALEVFHKLPYDELIAAATAKGADLSTAALISERQAEAASLSIK